MATGREIVKETWWHSDLVPGSYYKFRVRTHTESLGLSAPSGESDSVFLGEPPEDEPAPLPRAPSHDSEGHCLTPTGRN